MGQRTPLVSEPETEERFDRHELIDGELSGNIDPTYVFYSLTHVDWYRRWQRGRTGATSSPAMAAWRCYAEVRRLLQATARLGEKRTSSIVTKRVYRGYLG